MNNTRKMTIFSPEGNVILVKVNKVASTTLDRNVLRPHSRKFPRTHFVGQAMDELPEHMQHLYESWNGWFSFGFVRNPWDRMVSAYEFLKQTQFDMPFEEFIMTLHEIENQTVQEHVTPCHLFTHHEGEQMVDFVGRYERFNQDLIPILELCKRKHPPPVVNASERSDYRNYYTPATIERVAELYAEDIELFGYEY